jgi:predicted ATPase
MITIIFHHCTLSHTSEDLLRVFQNDNMTTKMPHPPIHEAGQECHPECAVPPAVAKEQTDLRSSTTTAATEMCGSSTSRTASDFASQRQSFEDTDGVIDIHGLISNDGPEDSLSRPTSSKQELTSPIAGEKRASRSKIAHKPVGELMEGTLSVSKRVSERMAPTVEKRMSEQGFTVHKLNFADELVGLDRDEALHDDKNDKRESSFRGKSGSSSLSSAGNGNNAAPNSAPKMELSSSFAVGDERKLPPLKKKIPALYGRDNEISQLRSILKKCCESSQSSRKKFQVVMIAGESGVGKSALARQLEVVRKEGGYFCLGKYDILDQVRGAPLTGIIAALADFSHQVLLSTDRESKCVRDRAREFFGLASNTGNVAPGQQNAEVEVLADLVPNLIDILELDGTGGFAKSQKRRGSNKTQLQVLLHRFLQAICTPENPLVVTLDDLQWADKASLDLIQNLVRQTPIPGFLLVTCYRSTEVTEDHALADVIVSMESNVRNVLVTKIEIGNLGLPDIQKLLSSALHDQYASQEQLDGLSSILLQKTAGNAYFLILFLKNLHRTGALTYNLGLMQWQWDNEAISCGMNVTENVAHFIQKSLEFNVSDLATWLLQIGGCLGNEFEETVILLVAKRLIQQTSLRYIPLKQQTAIDEILCQAFTKDNTNESEIIKELKKGLEECVEGGFLSANVQGDSPSHSNSGDSTVFRFVHDKVQEAAISLLDEQVVSQLCFHVGSILIDDLSPEQLNKNLFVALDCINRGDVVLRKNLDSQRLLELSIRAGEKAMLTSAFEAAVAYFDEAIIWLGLAEQKLSVSWTDTPDLRTLGLQLFNNACRAEFCAGNSERCMLHINRVLKESSLPIEDKLRVYAVLSEVQSGQEKHAEEYRTIMDVLGQLGFKFPSNLSVKFGAVAAELQKTKRLLANLDMNELTNLPTMTDQNKALEMKLVDCAMVCLPRELVGCSPLIMD